MCSRVIKVMYEVPMELLAKKYKEIIGSATIINSEKVNVNG